MVRPWRLIAQLALSGAVIAVFPSAGSAVSPGHPIYLTPNGPSPSILNLMAGTESPRWINQDQVTHTVVFANGLCSLRLAPDASEQCSNDFFAQVGRYPYTVDGTFQASVIVNLDGRTVTLTARSHTIKRGAHLHLHGLLDYTITSPPPIGLFTDMPVMVLARHDRHHPFRQIATAATGRFRFGAGGTNGWPWWLDLHPKRTTIYIAEARSQPDSGQFWQDATSKPFKVVVRTRH